MRQKESHRKLSKKMMHRLRHNSMGAKFKTRITALGNDYNWGVSILCMWVQDGVTWLLNSPDRNLPLILADNGFDVWIANTRGTRFSRRHTSMDPSDPVLTLYTLSLQLSLFLSSMCLLLNELWFETCQKFWNWSWDELVAFDLPAVFDFVYSKTGQKVNYVGHSLVRINVFGIFQIFCVMENAHILVNWISNQGHAMQHVEETMWIWQGTLFALASLSDGKLVDQMKSAALLSPIAYLSHMNTALGVAAAKAFVGEVQIHSVVSQ